jgi:hypothetical protein
VTYSGYIINGFRFHTLSREAARLTQNSGVVNIADDGVNYFERLSDVVELSYANYKVVLFKWNGMMFIIKLGCDKMSLDIVM